MTLKIEKPAEFIRLDLFPAKIVNMDTNTNIGEEFRVIITNDHVYFFVDGGINPLIHTESPLTDFTRNSNSGYIVATEENTFEISRATNCGCGSGLRGFYPFLGVPYRRNNV